MESLLAFRPTSFHLVAGCVVGLFSSALMYWRIRSLPADTDSL